MSENNPSILIVADEWDQMRALTDLLQSEIDCQVTRMEQDDLATDHDLTQYQAVFVFVHRVFKAYVEHALISYALDGGRLIVLHHAIASAKVANPMWLDFLGIHIAPRDDPEYPWLVVDGTHTLVNLQPNHYITSHKVVYDREVEYGSSDMPSILRVYPAFDLDNTEVFLNQHFTDGREKTVLLGFQIADSQTGQLHSQDRSGWYKSVGDGWVFYLQPGHAASDFQNRNFGQIVLNCLHWESSMEFSSPDDASLDRTIAKTNRFRTLEDAYPNGAEPYLDLEQDDTGWLDISPGPNLEGWQEYPWPPGSQDASALTQDSPQWHMDAETGTLLCDGTAHTHLLTQSFYRDFILHVEWRYVDPVQHYNSGVFVRMLPGQRVMHQVETRHDKVGVIMGGMLDEGDLTYLGVAQPSNSGQWKPVWPHIPEQWREHVTHLNPTPITKAPKAFGSSVPTVVHPPGEWNTYDIVCIGGTIVVRTNGAVSSVTDNCTVLEGAVGFESEGYAIEFRSIRVKSLQG